MTDDDLRAAVSAGIVSESQAARLVALSQSRAGTRAALSGDDEPFELFRGFSEIFISVGLVILMSGIVGLSTLSGQVLAVALTGVVLSVALALYFTRRRRMVLPSIVLTCAFGLSLSAVVLWGLGLANASQVPATTTILGVGAAIIAGLAVWFWQFKVPFTMFLIGATALVALLLSISTAAPVALYLDWTTLFDLGQGSRLAIGTLAFGIVAFIAGMAFDMRDPHRIGRYSASGFWLHVLAAPALVNTVAITFLNRDSAGGYVGLAVSLLVITLLALVIDRRSFLTAGIGYLGVLLGLVLTPEGGGGPLNWAAVMIVLGGFITLTGAFWTAWRGTLLRALPEFPGKDRLPPYGQ
jgi:hypothetical protein